jgi:hypothetical protein
MGNASHAASFQKLLDDLIQSDPNTSSPVVHDLAVTLHDLETLSHSDADQSFISKQIEMLTPDTLGKSKSIFAILELWWIATRNRDQAAGISEQLAGVLKSGLDNIANSSPDNVLDNSSNNSRISLFVEVLGSLASENDQLATDTIPLMQQVINSNHLSSETRAQAVWILARIGAKRPNTSALILDEIIRNVESRDSNVADRAINGLILLADNHSSGHDQRIIEKLQQQVNSPTPGRAIEALGRIAAVHPAMIHKIISVLQTMSGSNDRAVLHDLVQALTRIGSVNSSSGILAANLLMAMFTAKQDLYTRQDILVALERLSVNTDSLSEVKGLTLPDGGAESSWKRDVVAALGLIAANTRDITIYLRLIDWSDPERNESLGSTVQGTIAQVHVTALPTQDVVNVIDHMLNRKGYLQPIAIELLRRVAHERLLRQASEQRNEDITAIREALATLCEIVRDSNNQTSLAAATALHELLVSYPQLMNKDLVERIQGSLGNSNRKTQTAILHTLHEIVVVNPQLVTTLSTS